MNLEDHSRDLTIEEISSGLEERLEKFYGSRIDELSQEYPVTMGLHFRIKYEDALTRTKSLLKNKDLRLLAILSYCLDENRGILEYDDCKVIRDILNIYEELNLTDDETNTLINVLRGLPTFDGYQNYLKAFRENHDASVEAINQFVTLKIPDYKLIKVLGEGATKIVFQARHITGREYALKVFNPSKIDNILKRKYNLNDVDFLRHEFEAEQIGRLANPNINPVILINRYENPKGGTHLYVEREELFDLTLEDLIRREGKLTPEMTLDLTEQILDGLIGFHIDMKKSHGDLKPSNVGLKKENGRYVVKLSDYGFATTFKDGEDTINLGSLSVRAPELYPQTIPSLKVFPQSPRSDMWAVGVLMYCMMTGEYPFRGESAPTREEYEDNLLDDIFSKLSPKDTNNELFERDEFRSDDIDLLGVFDELEGKLPSKKRKSDCDVGYLIKYCLEGWPLNRPVNAYHLKKIMSVVTGEGFLFDRVDKSQENVKKRFLEETDKLISTISRMRKEGQDRDGGYRLVESFMEICSKYERNYPRDCKIIDERLFRLYTKTGLIPKGFIEKGGILLALTTISKK